VEFYKPVIQTATLNISGGANHYTIADTTDKLFEAVTKGRGNNHSLKTTINGNNETLDFEMNGKHHGIILNFGKHHNNNTADIKLSNKPVWDIDVQGGMAAYNMDLSPYKVHKLSFEGGMSSCSIKMGQPESDTKISLQGGMASFAISIPQNAACSISVDTGLSSKSFEGFDKTPDGKYQTPGFNKAAKKILINIEGGMASFKVTRY
jgi:hypothetical protein